MRSSGLLGALVAASMLAACLARSERQYIDDQQLTNADASTGTQDGGGNVPPPDAGADVGSDAPAMTYSVGGSVTGLVGSGLVLRNNGGDDKSISTSGVFEFATKLPSGSAYAVAVGTQPSSPTQVCSIVGSSGIVQSAHITNVNVVCSTSAFKVGGNLSGLVGGESVVLRNNGLDDLTRSANGGFQFATAIASGQGYAVTVFSKPARVTCTPAMATGTIVSSDVTDVAIACVENTYTVGGMAVGVAGAGLQLRNATTAEVVTVNASGAFSFVQPVPYGGSFDVSIIGSPPGEVCSIANGTVSNVTANANDLSVVCQYQQHFDGVTAPARPSGWTAAVTPTGGGRVAWVTVANSGTTPSDTMQNHFWANSHAQPTDNVLTSPGFDIVSATAQASFRHSYDLEDGYDGGVLEISIDGAAFADVLAAGGTFAQGGYDDVIDPNYNNPLAGRQSWTGNSNGYVLTVVNLPAAAAGKSVAFRWRLGNDQKIVNNGWRIDTFAVTP